MRSRPKSLLALSYLLVAIGISLPVQVAFLFGNMPWEVPDILSKLAPLNWAILFLCAANAWALVQASPLTLVISPLLIATVAWNNWLVASVGLNFSNLATFLATLTVALSHSVLVQPKIRYLLTHPQERWWLTPPRIELARSATVRPTLGGEFHSRTYNLSSTGAFISMEQLSSVSPGTTGLNKQGIPQIGTHCSIWVKLDALNILRCHARVVRATPAQGKYPQGIGVQFVGMEPFEKKALKRYLKQVPIPAQQPQMAA